MLKRVEQELKAIPGALERAEKSAINKATRKGKTTLSKTIREQVPIKATEIKKRTRVVPATTGGETLKGEIRFKGRALNSHTYAGLPKQPPRQKGIKVSARRPSSTIYTKKEGRKTHRGAFVAKMASGKVGIFHRARPRARSKETGNAKIKAHFGPQIAKLARDTGADKKAAEVIGKDLEVQLLSQVDRILKRKKSDRG